MTTWKSGEMSAQFRKTLLVGMMTFLSAGAAIASPKDGVEAGDDIYKATVQRVEAQHARAVATCASKFDKKMGKGFSDFLPPYVYGKAERGLKNIAGGYFDGIDCLKKADARAERSKASAAKRSEARKNSKLTS